MGRAIRRQAQARARGLPLRWAVGGLFVVLAAGPAAAMGREDVIQFFERAAPAAVSAITLRSVSRQLPETYRFAGSARILYNQTSFTIEGATFRADIAYDSVVFLFVMRARQIDIWLR